MPKAKKSQDAKPVAEKSTKDLEAKLAALQKEEADMRAKVEAAQPEPPKESTPLPADRLASQLTEDEVARAEILRDPFDTRDALKILADPPGKKLRWISLIYRETRNMRGWNPVRYDDAIGREIDKYIGAPPHRMDGSAKIDDVVRRGDVILCWIDHGIWQKRQLAREEKANKRLAPHTSNVQQPIGQFGATTGDGLKRDANPYTETRKAPGFVDVREKAYRDKARGTHNDPVIKTEGQNMFSEAADEE